MGIIIAIFLFVFIVGLIKTALMLRSAYNRTRKAFFHFCPAKDPVDVMKEKVKSITQINQDVSAILEASISLSKRGEVDDTILLIENALAGLAKMKKIAEYQINEN